MSLSHFQHGKVLWRRDSFVSNPCDSSLGVSSMRVHQRKRVYAVGEGESNKVRVAMKKAMLDAEFGLAKVYGQELSGSERSSVQDTNDGMSTSQYTELIDKLVSQVPVVGFETVHQEVKTIDGKYRAFVLLKLPHDQFNAVMQKQAAKTNDKMVAEQFKDLERRLDKRRQQRAEEAANEIGEVGTKSVKAE